MFILCASLVGSALVSSQPPTVAPDDSLQVLRQAVIGSRESLRSGRGGGSYRRQFQGKPADEFTFQLVFSGEKFNLRMTDLVHPRSKDRPFDSRIVVSDGSATFVRRFGEQLDQGSRTSQAYSPGITGATMAADMPMDPASIARGLLAPEALDKFSVHVERQADGRLRGRYDLNEFVGVTFDASPEVGYNVVLIEIFNKEGSRTGSRDSAEWKRDGNTWYVAAWTRERWKKGEVAERYDFRYRNFAANCAVSADLFTLQALQLKEDSQLIERASGAR